MSAEELARRLNTLDQAVADLVSAWAVLEDAPLYSVGTLTLAAAALAELVVDRALEAYRVAHRLRGVGNLEAGLPNPELLAHVRSLIAAGPEAEPGVGSWS